MPPLLSVQELSASYGKVEALIKISFTVDAGEFVTILGANGAGKSTTIRCVTGLHRSATGDVTFKGGQVLGRSAHDISRAGVGLAPEGRRVFPTLTVRENILMGGYGRKDRKGVREDVDRWLSVFPKLRERSDQRAGNLSGGEQQMLAVARAMMGRPQLLVLDEPSLGMAPVVIDTMAKTLRDIAEAGDMSVLLVEQNVSLALRLATRGYVLSLGEVVFDGSAEELRKSEQLAEAYLGEKKS